MGLKPTRFTVNGPQNKKSRNPTDKSWIAGTKYGNKQRYSTVTDLAKFRG
jgi:hypothetical protein